MTFPTFKSNGSKANVPALQRVKKNVQRATVGIRMWSVMVCLMACTGLHAQETSQMQSLIDQSLSQLQPPTPEAFLQCIAKLERIDAMFPDSIPPKYQMALQSLNFAVMNPQAKQTDGLLTQAEQLINKMEQMKGADLSDVYTLRGFLYMALIVQDPAQNGQRYYIDVMQNYEKALKLNPNHPLAQQLQEKFFEGMRQATER